MKVNKNLVGRKVRALGGGSFADKIGDIGTIVEYSNNCDCMHYRVCWDFSGKPINMWAFDESIELVEDQLIEKQLDSTHMPYNKIWEMLEPKMHKNGFAEKGYYYDECGLVPISGYDVKDFQKAVALAYKIGYERAMKGRPFEYGEKKVKGDDVD